MAEPRYSITKGDLTAAVEQVQSEVAKLNVSQRKALRTAVGTGAIDNLTVTQRGSRTSVSVKMYGHRHLVTIGPRGKVLSRAVFPA